jgi:hypothetical protein
LIEQELFAEQSAQGAVNRKSPPPYCSSDGSSDNSDDESEDELDEIEEVTQCSSTKPNKRRKKENQDVPGRKRPQPDSSSDNSEDELNRIEEEAASSSTQPKPWKKKRPRKKVTSMAAAFEEVKRDHRAITFKCLFSKLTTEPSHQVRRILTFPNAFTKLPS